MLFACLICSEILTSSSKTSSTLCGHVFHTNCISKWLQIERPRPKSREIKKTCPKCRSPCGKKQLRRIYLSESSIESLIPDLLQIAVKDGLTDLYDRLIQKEEDKNPKDYSGE